MQPSCDVTALFREMKATALATQAVILTPVAPGPLLPEVSQPLAGEEKRSA